MNASEKIIAERYEADGYTIIKDGAPDIIALKDHGDYWEMIFDEVKTNRQPLQRNQKRAIAILEKMEGKPVYITVRRSRVLTKNLQARSSQSKPCHPSLSQSNPAHSNPLAHSRPIQANPVHKDEQDRPFTLDFLKSAADESKNLDEFIVALRNYKENKPLALTRPY